MSTMADALKDALPYIKYPSDTFKMAFEKSIHAIVEDADKSTYEPSCVAHEDAFEYLSVIISDLTRVSMPDISTDDDNNDDDEIDEPVKEDDDDSGLSWPEESEETDDNESGKV
jgi:hypothetical protein